MGKTICSLSWLLGQKTRIVDSEIPKHLRRTAIWKFQEYEDGWENLRIGYILLDGTNWIEHLALLMAGNMFGQALSKEMEIAQEIHHNLTDD